MSLPDGSSGAGRLRRVQLQQHSSSTQHESSGPLDIPTSASRRVGEDSAPLLGGRMGAASSSSASQSWQERYAVPLTASPSRRPRKLHDDDADADDMHMEEERGTAGGFGFGFGFGTRHRAKTLPTPGLRIRVFEVPSPVFSAFETEVADPLSGPSDGSGGGGGVRVADITLEQLLANVAEGADLLEGASRPSTPMHMQTPRANRMSGGPGGIGVGPTAPMAMPSSSVPVFTRREVTQRDPGTPLTGGVTHARTSSGALVPRNPRMATGARLWVQVSGLSLSPESVAALTALGQAYKIHPVTVADLHSPDTREKLEMFGEYLFLVVHAIAQPVPTVFDIMHAEHQNSTAPFSIDDSTPKSPKSQRAQQPGGSGGGFRAARVRTTPIQLVVFPHLVLSFHYGEQQSELNSVCRKLHSLSETRMDSGQWIVHAILDTIVSSLRPIVDATDAEVERIEELIFHPHRGTDRSGSLLKRVGLTRRRLLMLQQQLKSKQFIINSLIGREGGVGMGGGGHGGGHGGGSHGGGNGGGGGGREGRRDGAGGPGTPSSGSGYGMGGGGGYGSSPRVDPRLVSVQTPYLRDLYDHVFTMLVSIEGDSTMLEALQNTYLSQLQLRAEAASWQMNRSMKKFSAFATIILPLSLISGIMGMNVEVPSQLDDEPAEDGQTLERLTPFWTIIMVMLVIAGLITMWMKRRGHLA